MLYKLLTIKAWNTVKLDNLLESLIQGGWAEPRVVGVNSQLPLGYANLYPSATSFFSFPGTSL